MVRPPCCENSSELTKGPWSKQEDEKLIDYIKKHGHENWRVLPKRAGLNRCGKSCRLRWINYLNPNIKRGDFSDEEEQIIIKLHSQLGNKWSRIAGHLRGRTDNEIKNYWNTRMRKKLLTIGVDPKTHQPLLNPNLLSNLFLLNLIAPPSWNNAFYHTNNPQQFTQNLKPMLNQNVFDSINQLQLSQSLTEMSSLNSFPITNYSQQEPFHDINNVVKNIEYVNTLPSLPMHMASFDCEFQTKLDKICHNNYPNIDYIPENETSLPNLVSVETPNIVNQVESSIYSVGSPSSIMVEDWDTFWDNEANVIQWPENL